MTCLSVLGACASWTYGGNTAPPVPAATVKIVEEPEWEGLPDGVGIYDAQNDVRFAAGGDSIENEWAGENSPFNKDAIRILGEFYRSGHPDPTASRAELRKLAAERGANIVVVSRHFPTALRDVAKYNWSKSTEYQAESARSNAQGMSIAKLETIALNAPAPVAFTLRHGQYYALWAELALDAQWNVRARSEKTLWNVDPWPFSEGNTFFEPSRWKVRPFRFRVLFRRLGWAVKDEIVQVYPGADPKDRRTLGEGTLTIKLMVGPATLSDEQLLDVTVAERRLQMCIRCAPLFRSDCLIATSPATCRERIRANTRR